MFMKDGQEIQYLAPRSGKIVKWLREFMKKDLANLKHCPNCGGILPELMFSLEGKEYWFTCFMIRKDDETVAKTNYVKFGGYCMNHLKAKKEKKD